MPIFKSLTTGISEIVENEETIALMEESGNYEKVEEKALEEAKKEANNGIGTENSNCELCENFKFEN